ncbi:Uncharacterised protein [Chlamydia trachomatis]|nr:Uncharacterised protein [Chlamydia trachomatis]
MVDFPDPVGPTIPIASPFFNTKLKSDNTGLSSTYPKDTLQN